MAVGTDDIRSWLLALAEQRIKVYLQSEIEALAASLKKIAQRLTRRVSVGNARGLAARKLVRSRGLTVLVAALLITVPAFAGNLSELLRSPAYLGKEVQVVLLGGGRYARIGTLKEAGDDYLVLEVTNARKLPPVLYVIPHSAILFVRPLEQ